VLLEGGGLLVLDARSDEGDGDEEDDSVDVERSVAPPKEDDLIVVEPFIMRMEYCMR
jgi:hypothetical protein